MNKYIFYVVVDYEQVIYGVNARTPREAYDLLSDYIEEDGDDWTGAAMFVGDESCLPDEIDVRTMKPQRPSAYWIN